MTVAEEDRAHDVEEIEISQDDILYRLITEDQLEPAEADNPSRRRVRSNAFKGGTNELSIDIAKLTSPERSVEGLNKHGVMLAEMPASHPASLGFPARYDPLPNNPAHGVLTGTHPRLPKSKCKKLASGCSWNPRYVSEGTPSS